jgi:hypothetical protein
MDGECSPSSGGAIDPLVDAITLGLLTGSYAARIHSITPCRTAIPPNSRKAK